MNIYEEDGNGNYINMGVVYCDICAEFCGSEWEHNSFGHVCDKCQDKINLDDKYHNETYNLGLFKPTRMKFIDTNKKQNHEKSNK